MITFSLPHLPHPSKIVNAFFSLLIYFSFIHFYFTYSALILHSSILTKFDILTSNKSRCVAFIYTPCYVVFVFSVAVYVSNTSSSIFFSWHILSLLYIVLRAPFLSFLSTIRLPLPHI